MYADTTTPTVTGPDPAPTRERTRLRDLLRLLRPGQWAKNLLVVSVPLLDTRAWSAGGAARLALAVVAFTVASGLVYIVNDIADRHRDRVHPVKRSRPIASGRVSVRAALLLAAAQAALLAGILAGQGWGSSWPVLAYLVLSAAYSGKLKHLPILDVFSVAAGFVLRLLQGYLALGEEVSGWLVTVVFTLCLLLTTGKRRHELQVSSAAHRPALGGYSVQLTEHLMLLSAVITIGSYLLYVRTEAPLGPYALAASVASLPFALFGVFRYLQLVMIQQVGGSPVRLLLRDPAIMINAGLWCGLSAAFLLAAARTAGPA
ncbi:UbiA prenyltransferase family protein [Catenuloplanes atrovinosus]|uniref:4-hydroxybenzoate polyprenyltransferase n=1 Tax=Catenuloplanes atrovinosus TaxID=137266 RepID=A0AAE4C7U9_9ACTN|nr:UbiA prenyltransferase family protein [Catenuloplanes atrovinosus]MDR7274886.1 4-hydroxybenzoate polyprenyltransferase [Catenuloplanes atrovinosus]